MTLEDLIKENTAAVKENTAMLAQILAASERTTAAPKTRKKAETSAPTVEEPTGETPAPVVEAAPEETPQAEAPPVDTVEEDGPIAEDDAVKLRAISRIKLTERKSEEFEALRAKFGIVKIPQLKKSQLVAFTGELEAL